jgi:hypothetical protein
MIIFWLIIIWILGFILHEFCHLFAARLQGCKGKIVFKMYKGILGLRYSLVGTPNNITIIDYAGGLATAIILFSISFIMQFFYIPIMIACFLVGFVNLAYGLFEGFFIRKLNYDKYMKYHYLLYLISLILGGIIISLKILFL